MNIFESIISIVIAILGIAKTTIVKIDTAICDKVHFFGGLNPFFKVLFVYLGFSFLFGGHHLIDLLAVMGIAYYGYKKMKAKASKKETKEEPAPSQEKAK